MSQEFNVKWKNLKKLILWWISIESSRFKKEPLICRARSSSEVSVEKHGKTGESF